jgi:hypothetical protein
MGRDVASLHGGEVGQYPLAGNAFPGEARAVGSFVHRARLAAGTLPAGGAGGEGPSLSFVSS